jgi:hypothetical protein
MLSSLITPIILTWLGFMVIAIINGVVRNSVYKPYVGDLLAHQISTIIIILLFSIVIKFTLQPYLSQLTYFQLFLIGLIWVAMTIAFEFTAGHYLFGNSWENLLADYNIFKGRLWILVLLTELLAPIYFKMF